MSGENAVFETFIGRLGEDASAYVREEGLSDMDGSPVTAGTSLIRMSLQDVEGVSVDPLVEAFAQSTDSFADPVPHTFRLSQLTTALDSRVVVPFSEFLSTVEDTTEAEVENAPTSVARFLAHIADHSA